MSNETEIVKNTTEDIVVKETVVSEDHPFVNGSNESHSYVDDGETTTTHPHVEPEKTIVNTPEPEAQEPVTIVAKPNTYTQTLEISRPVDKLDDDYDQISLPSTIKSKLDEQLSNVTKEAVDNSIDIADWVANAVDGDYNSTYGDGLAAAAKRLGSDWQQTVKSNGGLLMPAAPSFKTNPNKEYTGEAKFFRFKAAIGMGTAFSIPLWHSGFWITIKTPSDSELLELWREMASAKVTLGRSTYGLIFSNVTSYTYSSLLDFIVSNLYSTTLAINDNVDIRDHIDSRDLLPAFLGLMCAIWPKGVEYKRACVNDSTECNYITSERLNPAKLLWVDTSQLTELHRIHMAKRAPNEITLDEVKLYKSQLKLGVEKSVNGNDATVFTFKSPSAKEYIDAGMKWISVLENRYRDALLEDQDKREDYLLSQAKATSLRQYTHYVKSISLADDSIVMNEEDDIIKTLDLLSSDDKIRDKFFEEISKFIDESVLSMVGIPTFKCPSCGEEHSPYKNEGVFSTIIPIDVVTTFFTLLAQKVQRINLR